VTDGRTVVASRVHIGAGHPATLYFSSGSEWAEVPDRPGVYTMRQADKREHVVIIASERLTNVKVRVHSLSNNNHARGTSSRARRRSAQEDWLEVPTNHIVCVRPSMSITLQVVPPRADAAVAPPAARDATPSERPTVTAAAAAPPLTAFDFVR
jgi:glutamine amidotransferase